ncbi:MAG: amidotransferase [Bacteroidales bacterium]|nr:MAG: amidotransferase [Bacteroidales bacterium]
MKIGLLVCDHIQEGFPGYPELFGNLLPHYELVSYFVCDGNFPISANDHEAWLITGSKYSVYDGIDWIDRLKVFVREVAKADKYCIGVCFGHQVLGEAMGGKVLKSPIGWCVGVHQFDIIVSVNWITPKQQKVNLLMSCQDQIQALPPNSKVIAKAPNCPVGMIQIGNKMLGMQGHPEFAADYVKYLMEDRTNSIGEQTVKVGVESLKTSTHSLILSQWISNFLCQ